VVDDFDMDDIWGRYINNTEYEMMEEEVDVLGRRPNDFLGTRFLPRNDDGEDSCAE
jgi:hypothetical protein